MTGDKEEALKAVQCCVGKDPRKDELDRRRDGADQELGPGNSPQQ